MIFCDKYYGQFGNRLFQYVMCRILAERTGMAWRAADVEGGVELATYGSGSVVSNGYYTVVTDENISEVYDNPRPGVYQLWGFFQKTRFYLPYRDKIREWLAPFKRFPSDGIVVHVRRGDYSEVPHSILLEDYYADVLKQVPAGLPVRVIGVGRGLLCGHEIRPSVNAMWDFGVLLGAKYIVMSNSTFAWWGAWLSDAECWFPVPKRGLWSPGNPQELEIPEDRFHYVKGIETS